MWVDVIEVRWRKRNLGGGLSVGLLDKAVRKPIGLSTSCASFVFVVGGFLSNFRVTIWKGGRDVLVEIPYSVHTG